MDRGARCPIAYTATSTNSCNSAWSAATPTWGGSLNAGFPVGATPGEDLRAAIMAVGAQQDRRLRPVGADGVNESAQEGADFRALGPFGGPQDGGDDTTLTVEHDDRLEPVFVVVGI